MIASRPRRFCAPGPFSDRLRHLYPDLDLPSKATIYRYLRGDFPGGSVKVPRMGRLGLFGEERRF